MKATTRLRQLIERREPFLAPLAYDALTAKIIEAVGFEALFVSGYGVSLAFVGLPDAGLTTMTEVLTVSQNIVNAVGIPVIVDVDTGWGNAINVRRTVQAFVRAGAAGLLLEDQLAPKRCGHVAGKQLISIEEAVGKYRAAADAKHELDPEFVVIARTDARTAVGGGLEEAIRRAQAYAEAGADMIFVEALLTVEEIEVVAREIRCPKMLNNGVGQTPALPISHIKALGYSLVVSGNLKRAAAKAAWDYAVALKEDGVVAMREFQESTRGHALEDYHDFAGFPEIRRLEEKYLPEEEIEQKYAESIGYQP